MPSKRLSPVHPGEVLLEEFLEPLGLTQYRLAKDLSVPARRINEIVLRRRGISADTALRLALYFRTTPQFWLNLQARYELDTAQRITGKRILKTVHPAPALVETACGQPRAGAIRRRRIFRCG